MSKESVYHFIVWHCTNEMEGGYMFRPNLVLASTILLRAPKIELSSRL